MSVKPLRATVWARGFTLPAGYCYNCYSPSNTVVTVHSLGGIASSVGHGHGLAVAALSAAAISRSPYHVTYCPQCVDNAYKKAPEPVPPIVGLMLLAVGFGTIAYLTAGADRIVALTVVVAAVAGLVAWRRYIHRQPEPGQTTRWRAFAVLNDGKDLLNANREFVRIEYSNPRILEEILRLNPGTEVTPE